VTYIDPRHKVLFHIDTLAAIRRGETPPPINVEIDLSFRCSLGCEFCHFAYTHTRGPLAGKRDKPANHTPGGDLMDFDLAISIVNQLKAAGVQSITWTGGGEPTLHPRFNDIVQYAHNTGLQQGLYTHGGHINEHRAGILRHVMSWVYISLDECTAADYRRVKGVDYFKRAKAGINHLLSAQGTAVIGVGFLLHCDNWQKMNDMVMLGEKLGVDYVQFRPTVLYAQDNPDTPAEYTNWLDEVISGLQAYEGAPHILADTERFQMYRDWNGRTYDICHWSAVQTVITPNGKMWTCVNLREHTGDELGDLSQEPFADIWQRRQRKCVDSQCRVMCRGHIGNLTLDTVMTRPAHHAFI